MEGSKQCRKSAGKPATTAFAVQHFPSGFQVLGPQNAANCRPWPLAFLSTVSCTSQWLPSLRPADQLGPCRCRSPWFPLGHHSMGRRASRWPGPSQVSGRFKFLMSKLCSVVIKKHKRSSCMYYKLLLFLCWHHFALSHSRLFSRKSKPRESHTIA